MAVVDGGERTLILCFKKASIVSGSLRCIQQEAWARVFNCAPSDILSVVSSGAVEVIKSARRETKVSSNGITGYLFSESSLFLSDTKLTLKTHGQTTPLDALEPILDLVVPRWRQILPSRYLKFVVYTRLSHAMLAKHVNAQKPWSDEADFLYQYFKGDASVLGSTATSTYHAYVASYLGENVVTDVFSTQVSLTSLNPVDSHQNFVGQNATEKHPLKALWEAIHGDDERSIAGTPTLDERFHDPAGFSANAVFGKHFTTMHATPEPNSSFLGMETSAPLTKVSRQKLSFGVQSMCRAGEMSISEFALTTSLFSGKAPAVPGFKVTQSSQTIGATFACAFHYYKSVSCEELVPPSPPTAYPRTLSTIEASGGTQSGEDTPNIIACEFAASWEAAVDSCNEAKSEEESACIQSAVPIVFWRGKVKDLRQAPVAAASEAVKLLSCGGETDDSSPVALLDLGMLKRRAELWQQLLPRVEPFYATKCCPDPNLMAALWKIWEERGKGGFDCASPAEMDLAISVGATPGKNIVYANPCKQRSAVNHAKRTGVKRMVFDNLEELDKIKDIYPEADLILRIQTDDALAQCPLSNKFGATIADCPRLLERAISLDLKVVGVSFHVGSGCSQSGAFENAMRRAKIVFDEAERHGCFFKLLDIGGGFPGCDEEGSPTFADHAADIRLFLDELFPSPEIQVIAEPGRFFAATSLSIMATVISVADTTDPGSKIRYYLNDGLYGSFNCLLYDHASVPHPKIIRAGKVLEDHEAGQQLPCIIFGPTCDGFDLISDKLLLPRLKPCDHLLFENMGAYTSAASTKFNGFQPAKAFVYESTVCMD